MQLTTEHLEQYIGVLEEADKAFVGDVKRDFVAQAQADIFFQLGIRDKDLMRWGLNQIGIIKGQYHTAVLDIISKFQTGKYSFDKAFSLWRDATKTGMEGMYRAGAATVGNPFYKELKLPTRDKRLLARYLHREGKFWKKFMWDVKDPKHTAFIPRDATGKRLPGYKFKMFDYSKRAGMYPQSLEAMRYNGQLMGAGENIELRWVLGVPQTESCGDCMGLSKRVWLPRSLPTVPRAGDTACLYRCYCHLEPRQRVMRTTFDIAGSATEGAIRAAGRYSQVLDTAGNEIGGELQREIEVYSAQMNRARQMMSITIGKDKAFWIAERKRFNRLIIDRCRAGQYRAIPTVSVSALTKTIRAAQLKGGTLVDDFMTLVAGDEVWFVRSDYSSFGVIGTRNGVRVFKSPTGVVLNLDVEADIIFAAGKSDKFFMNQFAEAIKAGKSPNVALYEVLGERKDLWQTMFSDWTTSAGSAGNRGVLKKFLEKTFGVANYQIVLTSKAATDQLFRTMVNAYGYTGTKTALVASLKETLRIAKACAYEHLRMKYPKGYVTLYRGVSRHEFKRVHKMIKGRRAMNIDALSGFTEDISMAKGFAESYEGYVVKVQVSLDNILSSPDFRFSAFPSEKEWLVLGKDGLTKLIKVADFGYVETQYPVEIMWGKLHPGDIGIK